MLDFKKKLQLSILIFLINIGQLSAQFQEFQNLPASTHWKQIQTGNFQIIFPEGFEQEANRTANIMETIREPASKSLYNKIRKFSIVLQNKQGYSNGFVTIAPLRSEFFTIYPQNYNFVGNSDWLEFLAVHEYRHMVQFSKAYSTTFNKLSYWLFGEYGLGAWATLAAPSWFWEGDAVGIETSMTASGRGRMPNFSMAYKANLMEKGGFNYSKQSLKSFKEFVPNHYVTGYFMTTHLKRKYGADIWDKVIHQSYKLPFIPFSFSNAIKKVTGKNLLQTYAEMNGELKALYGKQLSNIEVEKHFVLNQRKKDTYTNYHYPNEISTGEAVVVKSGFSDISTLVAIDKDGNERKVFTLGIFNDAGQLSLNADEAVWTEYEFDTRWSKQSYSVIKTYDIKFKTYKVLTHKTRYTTAAISPDGSIIAAIHNSENNIHTIHLLNAKDGSLMKAFDNPENAFYSMPSFSKNGSELVVMKFIDGVKSMLTKSLEKGKEEVLISSRTENYGHPILTKDYLYYNSAINGIDNIYAFDRTSKKTFQITNAKYGAFNPSISLDGKTIYYNVYSENGMDVAKADLETKNWKNVELIKKLNFNYEAPMVESEGISKVLANKSDSVFEVKKYSQLKSFIRPFSWGLVGLPVNNSYTLGISSQDILSTTSISGGVIFNANEQNYLKYASVSYQGFYPILNLFAYDGIRSSKENVGGSLQSYNWNETGATVSVLLPFTLTNSKYLRKINLSAKIRTTKISNYNKLMLGTYELGNGNLKALEYEFQFIRVLKRSKWDINPRIGQTLAVNYKHTPLGGNYDSKLLSAQSNLYFPGIFKHHSIKIQGAIQYETKTNYSFRSPVTFTRGFGYSLFDSYSNLAMNYALPLLYPDIHIGPLFNLQRVYANVFYDMGKGKTNGENDFIYKSYGAEVSMNFNVMRFLPLLNLGVRYTYLPDFDDKVVQVLIGGISF